MQRDDFQGSPIQLEGYLSRTKDSDERFRVISMCYEIMFDQGKLKGSYLAPGRALRARRSLLLPIPCLLWKYQAGQVNSEPA